MMKNLNRGVTCGRPECGHKHKTMADAIKCSLNPIREGALLKLLDKQEHIDESETPIRYRETYRRNYGVKWIATQGNFRGVGVDKGDAYKALQFNIRYPRRVYC